MVKEFKKLNVKSIKEFRDKALLDYKLNQKCNDIKLTVHLGTCGIASGAEEIRSIVEENIRERKLKNIRLAVSGCAGFCSREPMLTVEVFSEKPVIYHSLNKEKLDIIFNKHIMKGEIANEIDPIIEKSELFSFYKYQVPRVMRNRGRIDPFKIEEYIANEGYFSLLKALGLEREEIIKIISDSGLRGRGGAGFPTGKKWELCMKASSPNGIKFVVCNGDEGDPGAFMDRNLLESDPHSVIEGMIIAGLAIGSNKGYIYVRAEYPLAIKTLAYAIEEARKYGLLGENILGTKFGFDIEIYQGAGAFVCGEETALLQSIEGKRGMPKPKPPFPANQGLYGLPTLINNVETFSNIPQIILKGSEWFNSIGTETSKGTKIFALTGAVNYVGLIEVPMGITLRDIVFKIGGGIKSGKKFKAVQIGGPSGGCIPEDYIDTPIDYEKVKEAGAIMGSGGMIVLDEDTCVVNLARYFMDFIQDESCGQCTPCRIGTRRMLEILEKITMGKGCRTDIEKLKNLSYSIKETSLCGLGKSAPNPVLSTINYFQDEYIEHVDKKRCPAVECREIISSPCQHVCPIGTEAQNYIALIAQGRFNEAFYIILKDNPLPSVCSRVCHHPCESKCEAGKWGDSIKIRELKRFASDYVIKTGVYPKKYIESGRIYEKSNKNKVAIIGSGPAGLMAGYILGIKGHNVTIFEELEVPGGGLAVYIPDFRLPKDILALDVEYIKGVADINIKTNTKVGLHISFKEILKKYNAIFIATGSHCSKKLGIPYEESQGILYATDFLKNVNLKKQVNIGKAVGVIGGGNSAVDAARVAKRFKNCESVTIIYRRNIDEMPAFKEEIQELFNEGINIKFLTAPVRIIAENGFLKGIECIKMELGDMDETGRRRPIPLKGTEFIIPLDTLIIAIGEYPDLSFLTKDVSLKFTKYGTIFVNEETFETSIKGVFAGGDVVSGPATVINAMGAAKIASDMIDRYLRGKPLQRDYEPTRPSLYIPPLEVLGEGLLNFDGMVETYKLNENIGNLNNNFFTDMSYYQAVQEAKRCLRCDLETTTGKMLLRK